MIMLAVRGPVVYWKYIIVAQGRGFKMIFDGRVFEKGCNGVYEKEQFDGIRR
jgi:hypothetical protein